MLPDKSENFLTAERAEEIIKVEVKNYKEWDKVLTYNSFLVVSVV